MLSILIPTYNYDCYDLVAELHRQASTLNINFEIIVADECSKTELPRLPLINQLPNCQLIKPQHNLGRAKIRNFLADQSRFNHLLFLDSDSFPANNDFLKNYVELIPQNLLVKEETDKEGGDEEPPHPRFLNVQRAGTLAFFRFSCLLGDCLNNFAIHYLPSPFSAFTLIYPLAGTTISVPSTLKGFAA